MMRPCLIICLVIFLVIPENVHSFFYIPVLDIIEPTGNLTCYLNSMESTITDFQLCAIRVYRTQFNTNESSDVIVQNGIWFTNIFHHLITKRNCSNFSNASDVGVSQCDPMPYESVDQMILCICATDNCNKNLQTCQASIEENLNETALPRSLPLLTIPVKCSESSEISEACFEHTSIDIDLCDAYVKNYSVLCTIVIDGETEMEKALIEEKYEEFLDSKLHELKPIVHANPTNLLEERENYVYYAYYPNPSKAVQECACMQNTFCNFNISTCAPGVKPIHITTSRITTEDFTSESTNVPFDTFLTTESMTSPEVTFDETQSSLITTDSTEVDNLRTDFSTIADMTTETITPVTEPTTIIAMDFTTTCDLETTETEVITTISSEMTEFETTYFTIATSLEPSTSSAAIEIEDFTTETSLDTTIFESTVITDFTTVTTSITTQSTTITKEMIDSTIATSSMTTQSTILTTTKFNLETTTAITTSVTSTPIAPTLPFRSAIIPTVTNNITYSILSDSPPISDGLNNGILIAIIVSTIIAIVLCLSLICCQCIRSGRLQGACEDRSGDYQI